MLITESLMTAPFQPKSSKGRMNFVRKVRDWIAGKIADNIIASRLQVEESDTYSDDETTSALECEFYS